MSGQFNGVHPNIMRLEVRYANPNQPVKRQVSKGAKFARALGGFLGPLGMAASIFFPPLAIAGLAAYGMRNSAQSAISRQQAFIGQEQAAAAPRGPQQVSFIGYQDAPRPGQLNQPVMGAGAGRPGQDAMMNILFLRHEASISQSPVRR